MNRFKNFTVASSYVMNKKTVTVNSDGIFDIRPTKKKINADSISFEGRYPYVARGKGDNGIKGYIDFDKEYLNPANTISFGQDTATMNYQAEPYFTGDKIQIFNLNEKYGKLTEKVALYLITAMKKAFSSFSWGQSSFALKVISHIEVSLPVDDTGNLDIQYMQDRIAELEQDRIAELNAYLKATGLDDYELTDDDESVLIETPTMVKFKVGDVFHKVEAKCKKKDFDKRNDTSTTPNEEYCVPLVNAKIGDNGVMFYGRKSDWNTQKMCIDVIKNGAVATGTVYAQPKPVGVLWDAYLIKPVTEVKSVESLLYMAECIEKITKEQFSRDNKATWDRVKLCEISLPITSEGDINFDYMERYICAIKKLTIADLVKYRDKVIVTTRQVVTG